MAKEEKNKRSILSKLMNPLNHGEDLKNVVAEYEKIFEKYKRLLEDVSSDSVNLYNLRKEVYYTLLRFQTYVNALHGCPSIITNSADLAVRKSSAIKEAMDIEDREKFEQGNTSNNEGLLGATAAGSAYAIAGPTALMAFATTFGTAGTGTAISALGGAAATNAALAWIGGGAIAAGGAGMSGGATILGLMGPIGWSIAGLSAIAFISASAFKGKKNKESIEKLEKEIEDIKIFMDKLNMARNRIAFILHYTERNQKNLKNFLDNVSYSKITNNDYSLESYPHKELFANAVIAKNLGKVSNQSVTIIKK